MMTIQVGNTAVHIDPALSAVIEYKPDGLYLRASGTAQAAPVRQGSAPAPERRKRPKAAGMLEMAHTLGPVEMCLGLDIKPTTLRQLLSGTGYYIGKGGSPATWERHYSTHRQQWDRIIRAGWCIPKAMAEELEAAERIRTNPDIPF